MKFAPRVIAISILSLSVANSLAITLQDAFLNGDQQGLRALRDGDPRTAADEFSSAMWQGVAYYRAHDYEKALNSFAKQTDAMGYYNQGNALAHLGRYDEAITAYDKALALDPKLTDASFNRDVLKKITQQQQASQADNSENSSAANNDNSAEGQNTAANQTPQDPHSVDPAASNQDQKQAALPDKANDQSNSGDNSQKMDRATNSNQHNDLASSMQSAPQTEQQQTQQQYLERVPDNPGSLLKQIFLRDYLRRRGQMPQDDHS